MSNAILAQILSYAKNDPTYTQLLARCHELEESYTDIMVELSPEQREIIDSYFLSCTQLDFHMMESAYRLGRSSAGRFLPLP